MGLYSQQQTLPTSKLEISDIGTTFDVEDNTVNWNLLGEHNMQPISLISNLEVGKVCCCEYNPISMTCSIAATFCGCLIF
jgi:hypothetical protein